MEAFGQSDSVAVDRPPGMKVPARALNSIEITLLGQMGQTSLPPLFIEDENEDYDGLPLRTALDLRDFLIAEKTKIFRKQIIIARELGPTRPDGGPWTSEYEIACLAEGVNPWPIGDPLVHEPEKRK